jgi:hypothetical protein
MFVDQFIISTKNMLIIKRANDKYFQRVHQFAQNPILLWKLIRTFSNMSRFNIANDLFNGCY